MIKLIKHLWLKIKMINANTIISIDHDNKTPNDRWSVAKMVDGKTYIIDSGIGPVPQRHWSSK